MPLKHKVVLIERDFEKYIQKNSEGCYEIYMSILLSDTNGFIISILQCMLLCLEDT